LQLRTEKNFVRIKIKKIYFDQLLISYLRFKEKIRLKLLDGGG